MSKFQNKYRNESTRLKGWDYGSNAAYFVTICTGGRECYFGKVVNWSMHLSKIGKIANRCWQAIPDHFPFVVLDAFVVMPDHLHGIVIINKNGGGTNGVLGLDGMDRAAINRGPGPIKTNTGINDPETEKTKSPGGITGKHNPMLAENLGRIIRWFKGRTTFDSRKTNPDFTWQSRYHDRIIRDEAAFYRIRSYIINNTHDWKGGWGKLFAVRNHS